jgi:ABC-type multidrug transport system ATPase subunit
MTAVISEPAIALRDCEIRAGARMVLRVDDFTVPSTQHVAVIGPRGAGKSLLARLLAGARDPDSGAVLIGGVDRCSARRALQQRVAFAPAGAGAYAGLSPRAAVVFEAGLRVQSSADVSQILQRFRLSDVADWPLDRLPLGAVRRAALARLEAANSDILICDEPTAGLDPADLAEQRTLLRGLAQGRALIFTTNRLDDVAALADRVVVMRAGVIVHDESLAATLVQYGDLEAAFLALAASSAWAMSP